MDAQKKKLSFVLGGGVLAVALIALFSMWPPSVNQDDASGAIGAVKKHRQTQIASEDVILGDEASRHEQTVLFADYLKDAATLQSISADLASFDMASRADLQSRADLAAKTLDAHYADLQARYIANMDRALEAAKNLASRDANLAARMTPELQAMGAQLHSKQVLGIMDMEQLNAKLAAINRQLGGRSNVGVRNLESIERDLASEIQNLESRANVGSEAMLESKNNIANLTRDLASRADVANRVNLGHDADYLGILTLEAKSVLDARNTLGENASLENRANLGRAAENLASRAFALESRAIENLESRFAADAEMASRIQNMEAMLASAKSLGIKGEMADALNAFNVQLQSRNADMQSRVSLGIEAELAAIDRHMQARQNLGSKNSSALDAKTLDAKTLDAKNAGTRTLDAKNVNSLGSRAERDGFGSRIAAHLNAINRSLDARNTLGSRIVNRAELAATARNLEAKATLGAEANVGSRANRQ